MILHYKIDFYLQNLQVLDEELRNSYSQILFRFYRAFEGIHKYITELNAYVDELEDGIYIQQTVESIMLNEEGKQLMVIYLFFTNYLPENCLKS